MSDDEIDDAEFAKIANATMRYARRKNTEAVKLMADSIRELPRMPKADHVGNLCAVTAKIIQAEELSLLYAEMIYESALVYETVLRAEDRHG